MEGYEAVTHDLHSVKFRFYNKEDILRLSVKEISNPQTFDTLGHPNVGGLYDSALGKTFHMDSIDILYTRKFSSPFYFCPFRPLT